MNKRVQVKLYCAEGTQLAYFLSTAEDEYILGQEAKKAIEAEIRTNGVYKTRIEVNGVSPEKFMGLPWIFCADTVKILSDLGIDTEQDADKIIRSLGERLIQETRENKEKKEEEDGQQTLF